MESSPKVEAKPERNSARSESLWEIFPETTRVKLTAYHPTYYVVWLSFEIQFSAVLNQQGPGADEDKNAKKINFSFSVWFFQLKTSRKKQSPILNYICQAVFNASFEQWLKQPKELASLNKGKNAKEAWIFPFFLGKRSC